HDTFGCIQGEWTHVRHHRKGSFHGSEYYSIVCQCVDADGNPVERTCTNDSTRTCTSDSDCEGRGTCGLCNACHGSDCHAPDYPGPEPRPAPANVACFTGVGLWAPTPGGHRQIEVG